MLCKFPVLHSLELLVSGIWELCTKSLLFFFFFFSYAKLTSTLNSTESIPGDGSSSKTYSDITFQLLQVIQNWTVFLNPKRSERLVVSRTFEILSRWVSGDQGFWEKVSSGHFHLKYLIRGTPILTEIDQLCGLGGML